MLAMFVCLQDLMATMEKPPDLTTHPGPPSATALMQQFNTTSPPKSADYYSKKTTFFQVNNPDFLRFFKLLKCIFIEFHEKSPRVQNSKELFNEDPVTPWLQIWTAFSTSQQALGSIINSGQFSGKIHFHYLYFRL